MQERFEYLRFSDCNIDDVFFNSLKEDYSEFSDWFAKKSRIGEFAYIYREIDNIRAFCYLKEEKEKIPLVNQILPKQNRLKIGTLKIENNARGKRLGEGLLGIALWTWQNKDLDIRN